MKRFILFLLALALSSCGTKKEEVEQPAAPWIFPIISYQQIRTVAARKGEKEICRLVGWDKHYYYFDWSQDQTAIGRGTGRVEIKGFDLENKGSLALEKGLVTVRDGQVRNWQIVP